MKKVTFFCFSILLASCSLNEEERAMSASENTQLSDELESVVADYELTLKGYSFDELNKEKDELTPTTQEETCAEPELIKAIQDSLNKLILAYDSKTRTDTRAYGGMPPKLEYLSMVLAVVIENLYTEWTVKMEEIHMQPAMLVLQPLMEM